MKEVGKKDVGILTGYKQKLILRKAITAFGCIYRYIQSLYQKKQQFPYVDITGYITNRILFSFMGTIL